MRSSMSTNVPSVANEAITNTVITVEIARRSPKCPRHWNSTPVGSGATLFRFHPRGDRSAPAAMSPRFTSVLASDARKSPVLRSAWRV